MMGNGVSEEGTTVQVINWRHSVAEDVSRSSRMTYEPEPEPELEPERLESLGLKVLLCVPDVFSGPQEKCLRPL